MQGLDDGVEQRIAGIDRKRHLLRTPAHPLAKRARRLERHMPRRGLEEHKAHHVGARIKRGVERLRRGKAADFHDERHGLPAL